MFHGCSPHVAVTACALPWIEGLSLTKALSFIRTTQTLEGNWLSYWWEDDHYCTFHAAQALQQYGLTHDSNKVATATRWAKHQLGETGAVANRWFPGGSPFATALTLQTITLNPPDDENLTVIENAARWLIEQQQADGSWRPSAVMRIPQPGDKAPHLSHDWVLRSGGGNGALVLDDRGLFTTATAATALLTTHFWLNNE